MPDANGRLSPAEIEHIDRWVKRHAGGGYPMCPVCRTQSWLVQGHVTQGAKHPITDQFAVLSDMAFPHVGVICFTCGYTMFFNAGLMGLYPRPAEGSENAAR
jgi:hypothetical protein